MQAARDLVVSYLPGSDPIWLGGATHGEHRLDVFQASAAADVTLYVLSLALDGTFVPDLVSTRPHLPYDANPVDTKPPCREVLGVFARLERVHAPGASQARFDWDGRERTVPVNAGHALLIAWDTPLPRWTRPRPQALCVAGVWHPTVSELVAATADSFRDGYRAYHGGGGGDHGWAPDSFYEEGSFAEKLAMVETILDDPDLSDFAHGCLAAGPVENLIGHALLDHVTSSAENRARWTPLLRVAYWHSEPPDVRRRLHALLGTTDHGR